MRETELERLVVRLTGDDSSYSRMTTTALEGNKKLRESMEELRKVQSKIDDQVRKSSEAWKTNSLAIDGTAGAIRRLGEQVRGSGSLFDNYISRVKSGLMEIRAEAIKTGLAYGDSLGIGEGTAARKFFSYLNPAAYTGASATMGEAIRSGFRTVRRDESTYTRDMLGFVTVHPSVRRVTEREAEAEDYAKSLAPHYEGLERDAFDRKRTLEMEGVSRIPHRGERLEGMKAILREAIAEEASLKRSITKGGGGIFDLLAKAEGDWLGRGTGALGSFVGGVENPVEKEIGKLRKELDETRKRALEAEARRMGIGTGIEDFERESKLADEKLLRDLRRKNTTFGMSDIDKAMYDMRESGTPFLTQVGVRGAMSESNELALSEDLDEDEFARGGIGLKSREVRDRKIARKMKREGYIQSDINRKLASLGATDKAVDKQELTTKTNNLVKALNEEADALNNSRNAMQPYMELMVKLDATEKARLKTTVEAHEKAQINQRYGTSRADEFRLEKERLDKMRSDPNSPISADTYNRAMADLMRAYSPTGGSRSSPSMGIFSSSDLGESYSRLMAFRETAFGGADTRSQVSRRAARMARRRKGAALRRDPTEGFISRMLGDEPYRDPLIDLGAVPEEAKVNLGEFIYGEQGLHGGIANPYNYGEREIGRGLPDRNEELLERIAKAVEKDADVKIETAGIK